MMENDPVQYPGIHELVLHRYLLNPIHERNRDAKRSRSIP